VFLNTWYQFPAGAERVSNIDWAALIALKADVARDLERLRTAGAIGAPLEAEVRIFAPAAQAARFAALRDELRFLLITSQAHVTETDTPPASTVSRQRTRRVDRGPTEYAAQVRAVLASAKRCRQRSAPPGVVRAVCGQRRGSR